MHTLKNTERGKQITFFMRIRQKCPQEEKITKNKELVLCWSHLYNDLWTF